MAYLSDRTLDHLREVARIPDLFGTRYALEGELGRGGMGVVYRVRDLHLDRPAAMKILDEGGEQAAAEARLIARLEHPGIVPVYDAGTLPDGRAYFVMKMVAGLRLDEFLAAGISLAERLRVFLTVCDAVAFAHDRGVIHRDLKPHNIMVGPFGETLVMDWGVARQSGQPSDAAVVGTPRYMAPEHVLGSDRPRPLMAIAAKAQAQEREQRYPDVQAMAGDIASFLDRRPVSAYRERPSERLARFVYRNRTLLLLVAAYVAVRVLLYALR
jgi:serine/threonine protein kinase